MATEAAIRERWSRLLLLVARVVAGLCLAIFACEHVVWLQQWSTWRNMKEVCSFWVYKSSISSITSRTSTGLALKFELGAKHLRFLFLETHHCKPPMSVGIRASARLEEKAAVPYETCFEEYEQLTDDDTKDMHHEALKWDEAQSKHVTKCPVCGNDPVVTRGCKCPRGNRFRLLTCANDHIWSPFNGQVTPNASTEHVHSSAPDYVHYFGLETALHLMELGIIRHVQQGIQRHTKLIELVQRVDTAKRGLHKRSMPLSRLKSTRSKRSRKASSN